MTVDKFLQLALGSQKIEPEVNLGVNQAHVLQEAKEILQRMYEEYICLYMRNDEDREHFLSTLATDLAQTFPRKKKRKSKSRKKSKKAKSRFAPDGIFYWKTKEFQGLSQQKQTAWRSKMTKAYPWLGFDRETEEQFRSKGNIRHWNHKDFKKSCKKKGWILEYRREYPGIPCNATEYDVYLKNTYGDKYAAYKQSISSEALEAPLEVD